MSQFEDDSEAIREIERWENLTSRLTLFQYQKNLWPPGNKMIKVKKERGEKINPACATDAAGTTM